MTSPRLLLAVLVLAVLSLGLAPRPAAPDDAPETATFKVDAVHSTALFRVQHLGAGMFWGRFNDLSGTFTHGDGAMPSFDVTIKIDSVDSGNSALDDHLKNDDFFDEANHPTMSFKSTSARAAGENTYKVTGELTMRGHTEEITVDMEWTGARNSPRGFRCGYEAVFTVKRSDFGVNYGVANGALGDETRIIVALEGVRQESGEQSGE